VRVVLQRVSRAEVRIEGRVAGRIARGYLLLVVFGKVASETRVVTAWVTESCKLRADTLLCQCYAPRSSVGSRKEFP
jgi:D-Tyr-tRNAtyr deacylase